MQRLTFKQRLSIEPYSNLWFRFAAKVYSGAWLGGMKEALMGLHLPARGFSPK